jgi:hypothetical protein
VIEYAAGGFTTRRRVNFCTTALSYAYYYNSFTIARGVTFKLQYTMHSRHKESNLYATKQYVKTTRQITFILQHTKHSHHKKSILHTTTHNKTNKQTNSVAFSPQVNYTN